MSFNKFILSTAILSIFLSICGAISAQENYKTVSTVDSVRVYPGGIKHDVRQYADRPKSKRPKNIILMIGDGMGTAQVFAGITANGGHLFLDSFKHVGFSKTQSASDYVTDSAAGGTALSGGYRTFNGAIGVDPDTTARPTVLEISESRGKATGLVSTSAITHATPASFIAHQSVRSRYEAIAADFLKTDIDVFIGGGYSHFAERKDGRDLTVELQQKGYTLLRNIDDIAQIESGKLAGLTAPIHNGRTQDRGDMLPRATETAINILSKDRDGFFLMVEGSQIDWGGHQNNTRYIVEEILDFDKAVGKALAFAAKNRETLIVVTADHETGGMTITGGDIETGMVRASFSNGHHTAVMVPVFAFGPGANNFTGIMENDEIGKKLKELVLSIDQ